MSRLQRLANAFPDEGKAICSVFFTTTDLAEKTWYDFKSLAKADDVTFWTVIAHHPKLNSILHTALNKIDHAHHSVSPATRRTVTRDQVQALSSVILRVACDTEECVRRGVDITDLARHINALLPLPQFCVFTSTLLHTSGKFVSLTGYCLHLLNPMYLTGYNTFILEWREIIDRVVKRCVKELGRGRYQRLSGDILLLFEQTYRAVKQVWATLMACPFVADFLPIANVLRAMRIVTDVISPLLQHFLMTCETLVSRRETLSKANAALINAALQTSTVLLLFRRFSDGSERMDYLNQSLSHKLDERVVELSETYAHGYPAHMLRQWTRRMLPARKGLQELYEALVPPGLMEKERRAGEVLLALMDPVISESGDFSTAAPKRQRFFELLLMELVNQGVHIDNLLERRLVLPKEAQELGASQQTVMCALAGIPTEDQVPKPSRPAPLPSAPLKNTSAAAVEFEENSLEAQIHDIFPHFSAVGIRAALQHYHNDVEHFVDEASINNLPPHLVELLGFHDVDHSLEESNPNDNVQLGFDAFQLDEQYAAHSEGPQHLNHGDFDDTLQLTDFSLFWEVEEDGARGSDDDEDALTDYVTVNPDDAVATSGFNVSEEMREKIRILNEIMYEDEPDDGLLDAQLLGNNRSRKVKSKAAESDDDTEEEDAAAAEETVAEAAPVRPPYAQRPPPRSDYDNKKFHVKREKERHATVQQKQAERGERDAASKPAYAKKDKAVKQERKVRTGKAELAKSLKKMSKFV